MNLVLSEEQALLVEQIHQFAKGQLASQHPEHDSAEAEARFKQLAEQGIIGLCVPEEHGGLGLDPVTLCRCLTAIATVDASQGTRAAVLNGFIAEAWVASSHPTKENALAELVMGRPAAFYAVDPRKPQPAGYKKNDDLHCFQGSQSNAPIGADAHSILLMADDEDGRPNLYAFNHLDTSTSADGTNPGLALIPTENSLGLRDAGLADLQLEWQIPGGGEPLFGPEETEAACRKIWHRGQVTLAAVTLGVAKEAMAQACSYAQERKQFGKPIAAFQAIQWKIADMAMAIEGASLLIDKAACCWAEGDEEGLALWSDAARAAVHKAAGLATQEAIQIHGGYGFTREFPVERLYRDAHALRCLYPPAAKSHEQLALSSLHHT